MTHTLIARFPAWDDTPWNALASLTNDETADVCVIGLGGSGLSCIRELLSLGQRVIGIDAGSVAGGAAGRNGGFLLAGTSAFYHDMIDALGHEHARRLYQLTLDEMDRMTDETPEFVRRVGSLRIAASDEEAADCEVQLRAMRRDGFDVSTYDGEEGAGLFFPRDGAFQPLARCRMLALRVIASGALLFEHTKAISISPSQVRTPRGTIHCDRIIVAVDGRLDVLVPQLGDRVRTARLQMLATEPVRDVRFPWPVYSRWGYDYWQQLPNGRIVLGGCRDQVADSEWTTSTDPSEPVQSRLDRLLRDTLGVTARVSHRWAASVGYTANGLPIMDEIHSGVWAVGGYNGTGNVIGALYGRAVAQLAVCGNSDLAVR